MACAAPAVFAGDLPDFDRVETPTATALVLDSVQNDANGALYASNSQFLIQLDAQLLPRLIAPKHNASLSNLVNAKLAPLANGGLIYVDGYSSPLDMFAPRDIANQAIQTFINTTQSVLTRIDATGATRWRQDFRYGGAASIIAVAVDANQSVWISGLWGITRLSGETGEQRQVFTGPQLSITTTRTLQSIGLAANVSWGIGAIATWNVGTRESFEASKVAHLNTDGSIRWQYEDADRTFVGKPYLLENEEVLVLGAAGAVVQSLRLNRSGALRYRTRIASPFPSPANGAAAAITTVLDAVTQANGDASLLTQTIANQQSHLTLHTLNADGDLILSSPPLLEAGNSAVSGTIVRSNDNSWIVSLRNQFKGEETLLALDERYQIRAKRVIPKRIQKSTLALDPAKNVVWIDPDGKLTRLDSALNAIALSLPINDERLSSAESITLLAAPNGVVLHITNRSYADSPRANQDFSKREARLSAYSPSGEKLWELNGANGYRVGLSPSLDADRFCQLESPFTATATSLVCWKLTDGSLMFRQVLNSPASFNSALALTANGAEVIFNSRLQLPSELIQLDRAGVIVSRAPMPATQPSPTQLLTGGFIAKIVHENKPALARFDSLAKQVWVLALAELQLAALPEIIVGSDGFMLLLGSASSEQKSLVQWRDFSGRLRWQGEASGLDSKSSVEMRINDASIYLMSYNDYDRLAQISPTTQQNQQLSKFNRTTGIEAWTQTLRLPQYEISKPLFSVSTDDRTVWIGGINSMKDVDIVTINANSGAPIARRTQGIWPDRYIAGAQLMQDGALVFSGTNATPSGALRPTVRRRIAPSDTEPNALSPQHTGIWHNPSQPGQGLFYSQIGNSLFMSWFTAQSEVRRTRPTQQAMDPSRLQWFTLQSTPAPANSKTLALTIYENIGGNFANQPITQSIPVGQARLQFHACGLGSLDYRFNPSPSNTNTEWSSMPLTAVLLANRNCQTPTTPATAAGTWHDPLQSGQGITLATNQGAPGTPFFAGWFTYDPAQLADDEKQQTWFTLQGQWQQDGSASVKIHRTLGTSLEHRAIPVTQAIGTAEIKVAGCNQLTLQYRFDGGEHAAPMQNLQGQLNLSKVGGCAQ